MHLQQVVVSFQGNAALLRFMFSYRQHMIAPSSKETLTSAWITRSLQKKEFEYCFALLQVNSSTLSLFTSELILTQTIIYAKLKVTMIWKQGKKMLKITYNISDRKNLKYTRDTKMCIYETIINHVWTKSLFMLRPWEQSRAQGGPSCMHPHKHGNAC